MRGRREGWCKRGWWVLESPLEVEAESSLLEVGPSLAEPELVVELV